MTDSQLVAALAAFGHTLRLDLWKLLLPQGPRGLPAGEIAERMAVSPSSLSFHLRQMTQVGVLVRRRSSRQIIYAVNLDVVGGILRLFSGALMQALQDPDQTEDSGSGIEQEFQAENLRFEPPQISP